MTPNTDSALWDRVLRDDDSAFADLFDRHADRVYRYCFSQVHDWAVAEDLTAIVFLETWRRRHTIEVAEDIGLIPWLIGVSRNVARNQQRALRRYRRVIDEIPPLEPERDFADSLAARLDAERTARELLERAHDLPAGERDVLALAWVGLSSAEIAATLKVPESTVRSRLHRLRKRLTRQRSANAAAARSSAKGAAL